MLSSVKCLVTGASSGIGKATCKVLSSYGASVIGTGRNSQALEALVQEGYILDYIVADLTEDVAVSSGDETKISICAHVISQAVEKLGGEMNALVNNAGVLKAVAIGDPTMSGRDMMENYQYHFKANTQVPFELMVHAIPHLRKSAAKFDEEVPVDADGKDQSTQEQNKIYPSIINVSSVNGKQAFAGCTAYCMSKSAIDQLTRCASVDLAPYGIRVNAVNPGVVETNLQRTGGLSEDKYKAFLQRSIDVTHPLAKALGRVGKPEEVGELIAFLLSDKASFITGECIAIDGARQNLGAR